jgi:hypothetical protein
MCAAVSCQHQQLHGLLQAMLLAPDLVRVSLAYMATVQYQNRAGVFSNFCNQHDTQAQRLEIQQLRSPDNDNIFQPFPR